MAENLVSDTVDYCRYFKELPPVCAQALKKGKKEDFKTCNIWVRKSKENGALIEKIGKKCGQGNSII